MNLSLLLQTRQHRGDHDAEVRISYEYLGPDESLANLVKRIGLSEPTDWIEIRIESVRQWSSPTARPR